MDLALYYSPGACSLAAHIALREAGLPFALKRVAIANAEHLSDAYRAINPRCRVPTLIVDGEVVRELSGILTWIGQIDGNLYPKAGTIAAAKCAEWLAWLTSSVHISFAMIWRGGRFLESELADVPLRRRGLGLLAEQFQEIESALVGRDYLVGDTFSVADANLIVFYRWGGRVGFNMSRRYPAWTAHTNLLLRRPCVVEALSEEKISIAVNPDDGMAEPSEEVMTPERLTRFSDAWTSRDLETLLSTMDEDGVYSASVGPEPGMTYRGARELRKGFKEMLHTDSAGVRTAGPSWILGDIGLAFWQFDYPATRTIPARTVRGIDYFEFKNGKIKLKDAYRKTRESS